MVSVGSIVTHLFSWHGMSRIYGWTCRWTECTDEHANEQNADTFISGWVLLFDKDNKSSPNAWILLLVFLLQGWIKVLYAFSLKALRKVSEKWVQPVVYFCAWMLCSGWGLRCLNDIPKGGFICIYAGQLLTDMGANDVSKGPKPCCLVMVVSLLVS